MTSLINADESPLPEGGMEVIYGFDDKAGHHAVYVKMDSGFYFGMTPEQAKGLGEKLIAASIKCTQ